MAKSTSLELLEAVEPDEQPVEETDTPVEARAEPGELERLTARMATLEAAHAAYAEQHNALVAELNAHSEHIARLHAQAHSTHTLDADLIQQITAQASAHALAQLHKHLGISGLPARGDAS